MKNRKWIIMLLKISREINLNQLISELSRMALFKKSSKRSLKRLFNAKFWEKTHKLSVVYLRTETNFVLLGLICFEISDSATYQLTCCSQYMCFSCHRNLRDHGTTINCPHCRSPNAQLSVISRLKPALDDARQNMVRRILAKLNAEGTPRFLKYPIEKMKSEHEVYQGNL